ncbi:MAG: hypothetical protein ACOX2O_08190 [Bdellovibrionota bacterium]|jgi:hypothetical protein
MKADMAAWMKGLEEVEIRQYKEESKALLLSISKSTIDKILGPYRAIKGF